MQRLTASDGKQGDQFGRRVAVDGNLMAVGAHARRKGGVRAVGAVYVFEREDVDSRWVEVAILEPDEPVKDLQLGVSVSVSGTTIAAGTFEDIGGQANAGSVWTFDKGVDWP